MFSWSAVIGAVCWSFLFLFFSLSLSPSLPMSFPFLLSSLIPGPHLREHHSARPLPVFFLPPTLFRPHSVCSLCLSCSPSGILILSIIRLVSVWHDFFFVYTAPSNRIVSFVSFSSIRAARILRQTIFTIRKISSPTLNTIRFLFELGLPLFRF